ncbi:zinc ABC transporter substrate-binding protein [Neotabrizicola sp. sgz301269]|uniref:zinc ABC transporter substrate-binding protein n=1 Tax=Neotabrizicola sp. sgz301269 TaxID=3276282 RepID=UPI00376F77FE
MRYIIALLLTSTTFGGAAQADVPQVVTDILPVHSLAAAVMEGLGEPQVLLDKGASPHSFQMRPSQAAAVAGADLVIWVGPELTPWLDKAVEARGDRAAVLGLLDAPGTALRQFQDGEDHADEGHEDHASDDHDHDHGHDHGANASGEDHPHAGTDPHAWLDPANARVWVAAIAAELSRLDPDNAARYAENAAKTVQAINDADAAARAALEPVKDRPFVAFHDAYGYFAGAYGLTIAGTIAAGDAASPGARHLSDLRAQMQAAGPLCIFPEVQHDPKLVAQMAEAAGTKLGGALDPEGAGIDPGPKAWGAILTGMADTIATCLKDN